MVSMSLAKSIGIGRSRRDEVYVAAVPLRATKGPAQLLMSTVYSLNFWDLQHFMVIISPSSSLDSQTKANPELEDFGCTIKISFSRIRTLVYKGGILCFYQLHKVLVYDFQPQDPESIVVAVAALSGRNVPGVVLTRTLKKLPKRKCWFVGYSESDAMDAAKRFNEGWDSDLTINHHDCRNYVNGLVEYLTGMKAVLEHLQRSSMARDEMPLPRKD